MPLYFEEIENDTSELSYSEIFSAIEGDENESGAYDFVSKKSKLFRLLNCPFCLTTWLSFLLSIPFAFMVSPMCVFLIPVFNFFHQEIAPN